MGFLTTLKINEHMLNSVIPTIWANLKVKFDTMVLLIAANGTILSAGYTHEYKF